MKIILLLLIVLTNHANAETTIYLTRHAEKATNTENKDPELTAIGKFRAENIAKQLSKVGIVAIYSTNYKRTLQTAKPLANYLNLEIKIYDSKNPLEFAEQVKTMQGAIFIVGHSNTVPKLTHLISGKPVKTINEKEHDNLYQVILTKNHTILNRFKSIPSYGLTDSGSESGLQSRLDSTKHNTE